MKNEKRLVGKDRIFFFLPQLQWEGIPKYGENLPS
jgi:hypothetical protein